MSNNQEAAKAIIQGINKMLSDYINKTTKIYDGIIVSQDVSGKWNIKYNGKTHLVKSYGNITPNINDMVKVIIPQGNQNLAFFI